MKWLPRSLRERITALRPRFDRNIPIRLFIGIGLTATIAILFPKGLSVVYETAEGSVWNEEDLIAPFPFPIYRDPVLVEEEQTEAVRNTALSFDRVDTAGASAMSNADFFLDLLAGIIDSQLTQANRALTEDAAKRLGPLLARRTSRAGIPFAPRPDDLAAMALERSRELRRNRAARSFDDARRKLREIIDEVYQRGYIDKPKSTFSQRTLALAGRDYEELLPISGFLDRSEVDAFVLARARIRAPGDTVFARLAAMTLRVSLRPDIVYNPSKTQIAIQSAVEAVPRTDGIVKENERIVSRHERVTPGIKAKLDSYQRARSERAGDVDTALQVVGRVGHTASILFLLVIYLFLFRKRIFHSNERLLLIAIIILMPTLLAHLSFSLPINGPVQYLILVPTASMLIAIMFDSRVAFYSTVTISFLVGALRGNDYAIILASVLAGSLALYTVRDVKHRTQIFRSLAFIFMGYAAAILFDGLQRSVPTAEMTTALGYGIANAVLSPILTFGLLIFFERIFGIDTDLTLLELSDTNHPLLRDLSTHAPGTFHHSVVMGTLAEAAATAIGANPILARVGAYYHDIGKVKAPECFVENQKGAENIHESLTPAESAGKIIEHVRIGVELGREAGLPERIIEFIPAHHGTTTVAYFLEKERQSNPAAFSPDGFRYLGPTPASQETAIVMLADTIEAAARTLEEPTPASIAQLINEIVQRRLNEGQLEDSDLTFRELTIVKGSFLKILTGIHHSRIKYPTDAEAEAARKQAERTSKLLKLPSAREAISRRLKRIDDL